MLGWLFRKKDDWGDYYRDDPQSAGGRSRRRGPHPRLLIHYLVILVIVGVVIGTVAITSGATMASKLLQALSAPTAMVWMLLFLSAYSLTICRVGLGSIVAWFAWLMLSLAGNAYISNQIVMTLEKPFFDDQPLDEEPFDLIVVLGGGTKTSPNGRAQLSTAGDRIMLAARMVEAGKAKTVVCSGQHWQPKIDEDMDYSEEAMRILKSLNRDVKIVTLQGTNTQQEMESLSKWLKDNPQGRIGIITSAWHLPRALRLAQLNGVQCIGLPSDFRTRPFRPEPTLLVPGAYHLNNTRLALREHLARIMGQ